MGTDLAGYLQQIAEAHSAPEKAALIAEMSLSRLPAALAQAARRCAFLPYFTPQLLEAILGPNAEISAQPALETLLSFTFVEKHPLGYAFHASTRRGLLERYASLDAQEIQAAYRAILPYLSQAWENNDAAFLLVLSLNILGEAEAYTTRLDDLLRRLGSAGDYRRIHALFSSLGEYSSQAGAKLIPLTVHQLAVKAYAAALLGEYRQAQADYTQALALNAGSAQLYYNRGIVAYNLKDHPAALQDFSKAIELNPWLAQAYYNRGLVGYDLKQPAAALADYTRAIELDPDYTRAYYNRGNLYYDLKNYPAALADYTKAIQLDPAFAIAYNNRGNTYRSLQDYAAAQRDYAKAIEIDPAYPSPVYNVACVYALAGDPQQACHWLGQAISLEAKFREMARTDTDFDPIRQAPCFKQLLE